MLLLSDQETQANWYIFPSQKLPSPKSPKYKRLILLRKGCVGFFSFFTHLSILYDPDKKECPQTKRPQHDHSGLYQLSSGFNWAEVVAQVHGGNESYRSCESRGHPFQLVPRTTLTLNGRSKAERSTTSISPVKS